MKKVIALALALIMALSIATIGFAVGTEPPLDPKGEPVLPYCPYCNARLQKDETIADHYTYCPALKDRGKLVEGSSPVFYEGHILADLKASDILAKIVDIVKASTTQWNEVEAIVIRIIDFVENVGTALAAKIDVNGAVSELEAKLANVNIPTLKELISALKQKIKDLYAGAEATTAVEEETAEEAPAETGSSSVGIAVFAAVSVAAAAAYVCTKKKD